MDARRAPPRLSMHPKRLPRPLPRPLRHLRGDRHDAQLRHRSSRRHLVHHLRRCRVPRHRPQHPHGLPARRRRRSDHHLPHRSHPGAVRHQRRAPLREPAQPVQRGESQLAPRAPPPAVDKQHFHKGRHRAGFRGLDPVPAVRCRAALVAAVEAPPSLSRSSRSASTNTCSGRDNALLGAMHAVTSARNISARARDTASARARRRAPCSPCQRRARGTAPRAGGRR